MKKISWLLAGLCMLTACNNDKKVDEATEAVASVPVKIATKILGSFVGAFGDNKITLLITRAEGDSVEGRSVVGGNDRPFIGLLSQKDGAWLIAAREPGDDPNDGLFDFTISENNPDSVSGSWRPYNSQKKAKDFLLVRKVFLYDTTIGEYPQASQRELKPEDVENLMKEDLQWMRNEIFARHGYCFRKKDLREMFENQEWYVPDNVDVREKLTEIEKKNLAIIKRYEKYAQEYGDEYGR